MNWKRVFFSCEVVSKRVKSHTSAEPFRRCFLACERDEDETMKGIASEKERKKLIMKIRLPFHNVSYFNSVEVLFPSSRRVMYPGGAEMVSE